MFAAELFSLCMQSLLFLCLLALLLSLLILYAFVVQYQQIIAKCKRGRDSCSDIHQSYNKRVNRNTYYSNPFSSWILFFQKNDPKIIFQ